MIEYVISFVVGAVGLLAIGFVVWVVVVRIRESAPGWLRDPKRSRGRDRRSDSE